MKTQKEIPFDKDFVTSRRKLGFPRACKNT